jgi:hypothetical protein
MHNEGDKKNTIWEPTVLVLLIRMVYEVHR